MERIVNSDMKISWMKQILQAHTGKITTEKKACKKKKPKRNKENSNQMEGSNRQS
jgi:hypothetical protein